MNEFTDQNTTLNLTLNLFNDYITTIFILTYGNVKNGLNRIQPYILYKDFFTQVQEPYLAIRLNNVTKNSNLPQVDLNRDLNRFTDLRVIIKIMIGYYSYADHE